MKAQMSLYKHSLLPELLVTAYTNCLQRLTADNTSMSIGKNFKVSSLALHVQLSSHLDPNYKLFDILMVFMKEVFKSPQQKSSRAGCLVQSVTCLTTDACLTADHGSRVQFRPHTFMDIDHKIISRSFSSLPLIHSREFVVSYT